MEILGNLSLLSNVTKGSALLIESTRLGSGIECLSIKIVGVVARDLDVNALAGRKSTRARDANHPVDLR